MTEPLLPVPPPEFDSNRDPEPARCACGQIIDAHPAMRKDARWEGWCQNHGMVPAVYGKPLDLDGKLVDD